MKKIIIIFLLLIFFLSACGGETMVTPIVESTPTPVPTVAPTDISPTMEVVTPSTINIPTPNPTQAFIYSICSPYPLIENNKMSPNGEWIAVSCEDLSALEEANAPYVKIVKSDKSTEWTVTLKELTGFNYISYSNGNGWFPGILLIDHWHKDSQFVFLVPHYVIDGVRANGFGLYRFDTKTGKVSPYLPVGSTTYSFAFSHNDEYFIYHYAQENNLVHIVSPESGENTILETPENAEFIYNFIWSPDDTKIIFEGEGSNENKMTTLHLFDLASRTFTSLLEYERYKYFPKSWASESLLVLESYDNNLLVKYYFDINSKELERIQNP